MRTRWHTIDSLMRLLQLWLLLVCLLAAGIR